MKFPRYEINYNSVFDVAIYIAFAIMISLSISYKINYHVDEIFTYESSNYVQENGNFYFFIKDDVEYKPAENFFLKHIAVQPEHRFDYSHVWENQARDVHPPLYYALVHTICSFYPKEFSPWFAGSINIVFSLLSLYVLRKMSRFFLSDKIHTNILSVAFILSAGILSQNTFFRMYIMAMFWVSFLTYLYLKEINMDDKDPYFFIKVSIVTICGALTHYYCILYSVLISIIYGIWLLKNRKIKHTCYFCLAMALSGVISYIIFPAMIKHIFFSYRGKEVLNNASNFLDFFAKIKNMFGIINSQLFGGYGNILLFGFLLFWAFIKFYRKKEGKIKQFETTFKITEKQLFSYILMFVPAVIFFLIISKLTIAITDRYVFAIFGVFFFSVSMVWIQMISYFSISKRLKLLLLIALFSITTIGTFNRMYWPYLYRNSKEFLSNAKMHPNKNCICFYNKKWKIQPMFMEARNYRSIKFINVTKKELFFEQVLKIRDNKIILSFVGVNADDEKTFLKYLSGHFVEVQKLGSYGYGSSYVVTKTN